MRARGTRAEPHTVGHDAACTVVVRELLDRAERPDALEALLVPLEVHGVKACLRRRSIASEPRDFIVSYGHHRVPLSSRLLSALIAKPGVAVLMGVASRRSRGLARKRESPPRCDGLDLRDRHGHGAFVLEALVSIGVKRMSRKPRGRLCLRGESPCFGLAPIPHLGAPGFIAHFVHAEVLTASPTSGPISGQGIVRHKQLCVSKDEWYFLVA
jgi:hypothetical protein